jgi:hypothetical protein|nr:MAG TPA: hypothetical protein [Caudoviricetes sp.]
MIDIYNIVEAICNEKKQNQIAPCYATFTEILNAVNQKVKDELNTYVREKDIAYHRILNGVSFEIIKKQDNDKSTTITGDVQQ